MRRPVLTLVVACLAAAALVMGACWITRSVCCRRAQMGDELDWLRTEFQLSPGQLAKVRHMHEGYLPKCGEFCRQIGTLEAQLKSVARDKGPDNPEVGELLKQIGTTRAQCQTEMLKHFVEVSRAMEPEQGKRYLAEMQRLTLFSHETFEAQMSSGTAEDHVHHK